MTFSKSFLHAGAIVLEILWIWSLIDCYMTELDSMWLWILLIGNFPASLWYLVVHKNPYFNNKGKMPLMLNRWVYRNQLEQAEYDVNDIGNAYQFNRLARVLEEIGDQQAAIVNYRKALEKEPKNAEALWGLVSAAAQTNNLGNVKPELETLVKIDPEGNSGDVRLFYIRTLMDGGRKTEAEAELSLYFKTWNAPEAQFYRARLTIDAGNTDQAKQQLMQLIRHIKACPPVQARRHRAWLRSAQELLKKLNNPA